jgi:tetratricopeptide (TPR) repeat protein
MYVTRVGWLTPDDVLAGQFRGEYDRKHFEVVAGSQQFGEDVRRDGHFVTEAWRFRALEREWDGLLYLLPSPDGTGTFIFGFCVEHPAADNSARSAFLEFVDAFEVVPRVDLDAALGRATELRSAIHEWTRRLPPAEVQARLRPSRKRAIADISAAPGADNSAIAFSVIAHLEAFNDQGVELGPGYAARNVVRNLEKAMSLDPKIINNGLLGSAYLNLGEYDRAITLLERHVQSQQIAFGLISQSWFNLGEAWRAKGEPGKAAGAYEKAHELLREERPLFIPESSAGQANLRRLADLEKRIDERLSETKR